MKDRLSLSHCEREAHKALTVKCLLRRESHSLATIVNSRVSNHTDAWKPEHGISVLILYCEFSPLTYSYKYEYRLVNECYNVSLAPFKQSISVKQVSHCLSVR